MEKITNHAKYLKDHPYPNLYVEKKKRRYIFYKRCLGTVFELKIPFRKIKTVSDFNEMCSKWQQEYSIFSSDIYKRHDLIWDQDGDDDEYFMEKLYGNK